MGTEDEVNHNIWYVRFMVAWPIWAGGYPQQPDVIELLIKHDNRLRNRLNQCLKSLLGENSILQTLAYQADGYVRIHMLEPMNPQENSVELDLSFSSPRHVNLDNVFDNLINQLAIVIKEFFIKYIRESWKGANLFDVTSSWNRRLPLEISTRQNVISETETQPINENMPTGIQEAFFRLFWKTKWRYPVLFGLFIITTIFAIWSSLPDSTKEILLEKMLGQLAH